MLQLELYLINAGAILHFILFKIIGAIIKLGMILKMGVNELVLLLSS